MSSFRLRRTEQRLEFFQLLRISVLGGDCGRRLDLAGNRIKRAVAMIGRALPGGAGMGALLNSILERSDQTRLSDSGLARNHKRTARARLRLFPAGEKGRQFALPSDEFQVAVADGGETALAGGFPANAPYENRSAETFQRVLALCVAVEQFADQAMCRFADEHTVRVGERLEAGRKMRCLPRDGFFLGRARADYLADHYESGCDADAGMKRLARLLLELGDGAHDTQTRPKRTLRRILMRSRPAKIG